MNAWYTGGTILQQIKGLKLVENGIKLNLAYLATLGFTTLFFLYHIHSYRLIFAQRVNIQKHNHFHGEMKPSLP